MPNWTSRLLFAGTIFLGSFLLFAAEPIEGKMLLPLLGGAPAVWNTCLLFFQAVLLLAYLYAHTLSTRLSPRAQVLTHAACLLASLALLPAKIPESLRQVEALQERPVLWLLLTLAVTIGPAFFAVAATSPLLQSWFVKSGAKGSPYTLYAASNAGSLLALLSYPFFVEPVLATKDQTQIWAALYGGLAMLCILSGLKVYRLAAPPKADDFDAVAAAPALATDEDSLPCDLEEWTQGAYALVWARLKEPLLWTVLAAVPSSLMLGVTTYLTTDIAAIPLLWMLPLALYTLSFILVFARYTEKSAQFVRQVAPLAVVALLFLIFSEFKQHMWLVVTGHLSAFFVLAVACHGQLALKRPSGDKLTRYYFYMALGGVLGGAFNTLVAPEIFDRVLEYPLGVALAACLCLTPRAGFDASRQAIKWLATALLGGAALMFASLKLYGNGMYTPIAEYFKDHFSNDAVQVTMVYGLPLICVLLIALLAKRRVPAGAAAAFGLTLVAVFLDLFSNTLHQSRSFYGVLSVRSYDEGKTHTLVHGGILHGEQWMSTPEDRIDPRSYYHREGPLGQMMATLDEHVTYPRIAAIGLGTGSLAAYGHKDNAITFYELNPNVEAVARDPKLFTYVDDCLRRWCNLQVVIGDGRLKLQEAAEHYDLIVVDAFTSDAIPIHLVTLEAMQIYFSKITASGLVAFHISNRYVDLEPVLLNLAQAMGLGYAIRKEIGDDASGKGASTWVVLAAKDGLFDKVAVNDDRWSGLEPRDGIGLWRDDFANVARAFLWQ